MVSSQKFKLHSCTYFKVVFMKFKNLSLLFIVSFFMFSCLKSQTVTNELQPQQDFTTQKKLGPQIDCPTGFVHVYGNDSLGTEDFCVMVYEARVDESNELVFDESLFPKTNISHHNAFDVCQNHSEQGFSGSFSLISNAQWMTVAREIENVKDNWSSGAVGSGMLVKGHSDAISDDYLQTKAFATVTNINDPNDLYDQTGNSASQPYDPDSSVDHEAYNGGNYDGTTIYGWEQRRVHYLASGELLWDFSGNATELVDWSANDSAYTYGPSDGNVDKQSITDVFGSLTSDDLSPFGNFDHLNGMGKWSMLDDENRGVVTRGGHVREGTVAGIYSLSMTGEKSFTGHERISFRCVYRP